MTDMTTMAEECHAVAEEKGWHGLDRSFGDILALMHSELSEALEEYRDTGDVHAVHYGDDGKPEGVPVELADTVIRIFDYCVEEGIDIEQMVKEKMEYNAGRPLLHGGKQL